MINVLNNLPIVPKIQLFNASARYKQTKILESIIVKELTLNMHYLSFRGICHTTGSDLFLFLAIDI